KQVTINVQMPHSLRFALRHVSNKLKSKSTSELVERIFQTYYETEINYISNLNLLNDFFIRFYPYRLKDKLKGAQRWKNFSFMTDSVLRDKIKQLAINHKTSLNDFTLRVLSDRMVRELDINLFFPNYETRTHLSDIPKVPAKVSLLNKRILKWIRN